MNFLFKDGEKVCEVSDEVLLPGVARTQTVTFIGGAATTVVGKRTPDRVRFVCKAVVSQSFESAYELRDETGQVAPITITERSRIGNIVTLTAILG